MRHTIRDLLRDFDLMSLVYRGVCKLLDVDGPTHVAVWYLSEYSDLEFGHTWNGSYVRDNLKGREHNILFFYEVPHNKVGDFFEVGIHKVSNERIKLADLWRVYKRKPPRGMTCIKWVKVLLGMRTDTPHPVTMEELEYTLYTIGGVRTNG